MMLLGFGVQDALGVTVTAATNVVAVGNPVILNCLDMIQKIHAHRRASVPAI